MSKITHKNFLLEIGTEELPPSKIVNLVTALADAIEKNLKEHTLTYTDIQTFATPRRLAVLITDLAIQQPPQLIELRGPSIDIAFDQEGNPTPAAKKFAQTCQLSEQDIDKLERIEITNKNKKNIFLFYKETRSGKLTQELLPNIITESIKKLPIAKPMKWGSNHTLFVRPVHWVIMLLGEEVIKTNILGIETSNQTYGHRFHHPEAITIPEASMYEELLAKKGFVIADVNKRKQLIQDQIKNIVTSGTALISNTLLNEVVDLVEYPVALLGEFEAKFLDIPQEVLITVMEKQQRYFPIVDSNNKLLPQFVIISNIKSKNSERVTSGNERVIRARLSDAEFFYHNDLKNPLEYYLEKLTSVIFQAELGTIYNKTQRLEKISGFLAEKLNLNEDYAIRAAQLSKCDLVTSMVWEFPELQGIMGGYYSLKSEGENIAKAIREQYFPRFSQDNIPTTDLGCVLALADRIDNLVGLFGINKLPTGEKDPFGLRRASMGIINIILQKNWSLDLKELLEFAENCYGPALINKEVITQVLHFIYERLRYIYSEQNKDINIFRAVLTCMPTNLLDFQNRFNAVNQFNNLEESGDLIEIYKRIKNILNKNKNDEIIFNKDLLAEPAEIVLTNLIEAEEDQINKLYKNKDYFAILQRLITIKPALDIFFDSVMVMAEDKNIRANRLALLKKLQHLFTLVADWVL